MLAMIGGSGVYNIEGLSNTRWVKVDSPFGTPSDELLLGELDGQPLAFLPRHGRGHRLPPSAINYRANIDALKRAGATQIISVSAVGSLGGVAARHVRHRRSVYRPHVRAREEFLWHRPGGACVDGASGVRTPGRCDRGGGTAQQIRYVRGGTYLVMEGPQFSSLAESELYRSWRCDVIGMTNMPEAKLAREAELCYATVAMVTDYDSWHPEHDAVTVEMVVRTAHANAGHARALLKAAVPRTLQPASTPCPRGCQRALEYALITAPDARDVNMTRTLDAVAGRVLRRSPG